MSLLKKRLKSQFIDIFKKIGILIIWDIYFDVYECNFIVCVRQAASWAKPWGNLNSVSFPAATSIGGSAFYGCSSLNSVTLGTIANTTTDFSTNAFSSIGDLRTVYFAAGGGAGTYKRDLNSATPNNWWKE